MMEVSLTGVLFCILVCEVHLTATEEVVITHNGNFGSGLVLTCTDGRFPLDKGVSFQRNGKDIQVNGNGTLSYPLTQGNEGTFTCAYGGQTSEEITLAAEPPLDFPLPPRSHYVLVSVNGNVSTQLECDIGPGAVRESYTIEWFQINPNSVTEIAQGINQVNFNLTLTVDVNSNGMVYMCTVTIDHDGTTSMPYDGARITLRTAVKASIKEGVQDTSVTSRHPVNFSCSAVGSEVDIQWTIDRTEYESCPPMGEADICFKNSYMNNTATITSTLIIPDSSSLGVGSYIVQCTVEQELDPGFETDLFQESTTAVIYIDEPPSVSLPASTPPSHSSNGMIGIILGTTLGTPCACIVICCCCVLLLRLGESSNHYSRASDYELPMNASRRVNTGDADNDVSLLRLGESSNHYSRASDYELPMNASRRVNTGDADNDVSLLRLGESSNHYSRASDYELPMNASRRVNTGDADNDVSPGPDELPEHSELTTNFSSHPPPYEHSQSSATHSAKHHLAPLQSASGYDTSEGGESEVIDEQLNIIEPPQELPADEHIVPPCVKPTATLCHCTSQGMEYNDEWNDFTLKIPDGAIPEGESLTIDIGVALYGPFQYPEGLRPVSPVFWICVRDKKYFQFLKPVEVTLPHFLTLNGQEDVQLLGLTFLKGDHEMRWKHKTYFQQAEGTVLFRPGSEYGVLHTHHFCYLCITSKKSKETIRKAKFCMFATIPHVFAAHKSIYAFFFVTFLLKTCLETIRRQIKNTPELPTGSFREVKQDFQFADDQSEPSLEIEIPQQHPAGWTLGLEFNTKITQSEMDFIEMDEDELELKEDEQIYPPKFRIIIGCSPEAQQSQARIEFKGALKELVFDIPLAPQPSEPGTLLPQPPVKQKSTVLSSPVSLPDLLNHVGVRILSKWKMFGILLDIPVSELDTYPSHKCLECYARVFDSWERRGSPELAWGTVVNVLESPSISERRLAEEVRKKMASSTFSPSHTLL